MNELIFLVLLFSCFLVSLLFNIRYLVKQVFKTKEWGMEKRQV
jgi:hypothetical protein